MSQALTCERCGRTNPDVRVRLVRYEEPIEGSRTLRRWFAAEARCPGECRPVAS